jgi:hypothetical protein
MPNSTNQTLKTVKHLFKHKGIYLTILLLIILTSPYLIRYLDHNPTVIGESSYFHLNQAENVDWHNFYQNPYHLLLSLNITDNQPAYLAIPLILALLSLILLSNIIKKFKLAPQNRFFFLFFLILSPTFIYTFTVLNHHSFFIFLNLLGFTLLLSKHKEAKLPVSRRLCLPGKKFLNYLSFPVFALIPFFDIFSSILTLLFLAVYFYLKRDNTVKFSAITVAISTFLNIFLGKPFLLGPYAPQNIFIDFFSDFGGLFGISLFALLLAVTGLIITWKKEKFFIAYSFLILFVFLFIYQTSALIYLNFFIIFLASFGFTHFLNKEWKINIIKNAFLFLLIIGIVFSTLTVLNKLSTLPPSPETKESLQWLRENTERYQFIFSHPSDSYLVEYFSRRPAFIHYHDSDFKTKSEITDQILQSSYIKETFPLLEQNGISHIYLPSKTKENLPPDRGLIFLLQNERFKKIYNQKNIEIRKFK